MQDDVGPRPQFREDLPEQRAIPRYEILRTPPKKRTVFLILSERELTMPTHYWRGRTTPCLEPEPCDMCEASSEIRWKVYLAVSLPITGQIACYECTDHGGESIIAARKESGSLRGKKLTCWRSGNKENSPVNCIVAKVLDPTIHVPPCFDVKEYLYRMWYVRNPRKADLAEVQADQSMAQKNKTHNRVARAADASPARNGRHGKDQ